MQQKKKVKHKKCVTFLAHTVHANDVIM